MVVREDVLEGLGDDICRDGLLDEGSVGDDARQGALEFADVAVDAVGDEHQDIVRHVDVVEQRLVLEDGDARLEVRRLDVGDQAALEARAQAVFELLDFARRAVGRQDDLLVGDVQRVEGVEEFFLRALLAGKELDIVDHQDVDRPVFLAEELGLALLDGADDLVGELLTRDV